MHVCHRQTRPRLMASPSSLVLTCAHSRLYSRACNSSMTAVLLVLYMPSYSVPHIYSVRAREREREREKGESARATESLGQVNARHGVAQQAAFRLNNALTAAWLQSNTQRGLARANREKESRSICACWTIRQHPRITINAGYRRTPAVIHRTAHSLYLPLCPFRPPSRLSFARAASSLL